MFSGHSVFSMQSKSSVKLNFSIDEAMIGDEELINSSPSQESESNLFQTKQLLRQMEVPNVPKVQV
jgi:hypothetical protein